MDDNDVGYINFIVNTRFGEDWSTCIIEIGDRDNEGDNVIEKIYEHLHIISPLLIGCFDPNNIPTPNIEESRDS